MKSVPDATNFKPESDKVIDTLTFYSTSCYNNAIRFQKVMIMIGIIKPVKKALILLHVIKKVIFLSRTFIILFLFDKTRACERE